MKTGFLQSISGNQSSSRLIGFSVIFSGLLFIIAMVVFCYIHPDMAISIIGATGAAFALITGPTFIFLYNQKKTELKQETDENTI